MIRIVATILITTTAVLTGIAEANWPERLEEQRTAFREAWPRAAGGDVQALRAHEPLLADYPLYPDLRAAWLRSQLGKVPDDEVREFVERAPESTSMRRLRYRWATSLAERGQWADYLAVYRHNYAADDDELLTCYALRARLETGPDARLATDARAFWLHGRSRADECDPVFAWLEREGHIDEELRRKRVVLALENRQFALATWLARPLDDADRSHVEDWRRVRHRPSSVLDDWRQFEDNESNRELMRYAIGRLARRDFTAAVASWERIRRRFAFTPRETRSMDRTLAYVAASNNEPGALGRIVQLPANAVDDALLEAGVRVALREEDWAAVLEVIGMMSQSRRHRDEWVYWRARALEASGQVGTATKLYRALAAERSFYGFLAADRLDVPYSYNHRPAQPDDSLIAQLESREGLVRAREMFFVDLHGHGRSEWDRHTAPLSRTEKAQSAIMASRWGWHSVAISTAYRAGLRDDLALRYPMAFREAFEEHTAKLELPTPWAYGIARSESLFMPDVTSSAGALGVMQLMPETGRLTARQARIKWSGRYSLLDPQANIALGTFYLDQMYSRFGDHQVLATAAYNAGPHRVDRWLPRSEAVAADVWVETVPFRETRGYLRRVLAADVIFHWRLTGQTRRLSAVMPPVRPATN